MISEDSIICTVHQMLIRVIKSGMMRWAGHVAHREIHEKLHTENGKGIDHLGDLNVCGKIKVVPMLN
jgi:hypothetical protein